MLEKGGDHLRLCVLPDGTANPPEATRRKVGVALCGGQTLKKSIQHSHVWALTQDPGKSRAPCGSHAEGLQPTGHPLRTEGLAGIQGGSLQCLWCTPGVLGLI